MAKFTLMAQKHMFRSDIFVCGTYRIRVSYKRRHRFSRWQRMGVEVWVQASADEVYGYTVQHG